MENLMEFDKWPEENKLLIYYEDLIIKPKEIFEKASQFLNIENSLDNFFENYDFIFDSSIKAYGKSFSLGKDIIYEGKSLKAKELTYLENGKKVSFVLDTADNEEIVSLVKNADLFVCESSFGGDLKKEAREKMHLTAEDAGKISKKAKVGKLILTHISQRYEPKIKFLLEDAKKNFKDVQIANDFDLFDI